HPWESKYSSDIEKVHVDHGGHHDNKCIEIRHFALISMCCVEWGNVPTPQKVASADMLESQSGSHFKQKSLAKRIDPGGLGEKLATGESAPYPAGDALTIFLARDPLDAPHRARGRRLRLPDGRSAPGGPARARADDHVRPDPPPDPVERGA